MYSIRYPIVDPLLYWSLDPNGEHAIFEEHWETNKIPRLEVLSWIGSSWYSGDYWAVDEYLQTRNYGLDGRNYSWERGYPVLVPGDPFEAAARNSNKLSTDEDLNYIFSTDIVPRPRIRPKTNPRIIRYIKIIKTTGRSSRGLMRSTGRLSSSASSKRARANGASRKRRS
ncbi:hypothetical protein PM082_022212 [Marasmius tenuissimus]|nr:hypothetical protein PM082_022212 [Marasmius tenuissimus]